MNTDKPVSEHVLSIVKAGISGLPLVGGPLASLIGDYIPTATQKSVKQFIGFLRERLQSIENRIDFESLNRDEFSELFKNCYMTILKTHQETKLRATAFLLANILLKPDDPEKMTYTELDHYSKCLDSLSIGALQILGFTILLAPEKDLQNIDDHNIRLRFPGIQIKANNMDAFLLMSLLAELNSFHLIHLPGSPVAQTTRYGNYPVELPKTGYYFAKYILGINVNKTEAT